MTAAGKRALITGASRGIGAAIARKLAQDGFHVFINFSSNEAKAHEVIDQITPAGGKAELCGFDVSRPRSGRRKVRLDRQDLRALAVLVNNAGMTIDGSLDPSER